MKNISVRERNNFPIVKLKVIILIKFALIITCTHRRDLEMDYHHFDRVENVALS